MNFNQFLLICVLYREKLIGTEYRVSDEKGKTIDKKIISRDDIEIFINRHFYISFRLVDTLIISWTDSKIFCIIEEEETNWTFESLTKLLQIKLKDII